MKNVDNVLDVYVTTKDGSTRVERYLGAANDPAVQDDVERFRHAAARAKSLKNTVSILKTGRFPAPSLVLGRILEVLANAGLFKRGVTLVGASAYQTYTGVLGYYAPSATLATNDADLSVAVFVAKDGEEDIRSILKRADPTFEPVWHVEDKLPKAFRASNGFTSGVTRLRSPIDSPWRSVGQSDLIWSYCAATWALMLRARRCTFDPRGLGSGLSIRHTHSSWRLGRPLEASKDG